MVRVNNHFKYIYFAFLVLLFFFSGGLNETIFLYLSIGYGVYGIYFLQKSQTVYLHIPLGILWLAWIFMSILQLFIAVKPEDAWMAFIRYGVIVLVFFTLFHHLAMVRESKNAKFYLGYESVLKIIFLLGVLASVMNMGMVAITQQSDIRFYLPIGYANSCALLLLFSTFAGIQLLNEKVLKTRWRIVLWKFGVSLCLCSVVLTMSRTVWILTGMLFIYWILREKGERLFAILLCAITTGVMMLLYLKWSIWGSLLVGVFIIWTAEYAKEKYFKFNSISSMRKVVLFGIPSIFILSLLLIFRPQYLVQRLRTLNLNASELQERLVYYTDALNMIKDFPIFGMGPGGWSSMQYQYQTALYATKYVHNVFYQVVLDYGLAGLSIFVLQIGIVVYCIVKLWKNEGENEKSKRMIESAIFYVLTMFLHSLLEIHFEFPFFIMLLWLQIAYISVGSNFGIFAFNLKAHPILKNSMMTILLIFMLLHIPLLISKSYFTKGINAYKNYEFQMAKENFEITAKWFPISSSAYNMMGECSKQIALQYNSKQNIDYGIQAYEKARQYDRYNPRYPAGIAFLSERSGNAKRSVEEYEKLLRLQPLVIEYYEAYAKGAFIEAEKQYGMGNFEMAKKHFQAILDLDKSLDKQMNRVSPRVLYLKHKVDLQPTSNLKNLQKMANEKIDSIELKNKG